MAACTCTFQLTEAGACAAALLLGRLSGNCSAFNRTLARQIAQLEGRSLAINLSRAQPEHIHSPQFCIAQGSLQLGLPRLCPLRIAHSQH